MNPYPSSKSFTLLVAMILILVLLCFGGCASWTPETRAEETVYQTLHVVDAAQTLEIARHPCYREAESRWLLGAHPSQGRVLGAMAATGAAHALVTDMLEAHDASPTTKRIWQFVTIGAQAEAVGNNISIGIRVGGTRCN